jgi:hypothetical protein
MRRGADRQSITRQAEAPGADVVTPGQVAPRLAMLEVSCNRCDRHGRIATARLLVERRVVLPMPELHWIVAVDCARHVAAGLGMVFPLCSNVSTVVGCPFGQPSCLIFSSAT